MTPDPAMERAVAALAAGGAVVLPTDTVYGLVADARSEPATLRLYTLKRRPRAMPFALLCADVDTLVELVPELRGRPAAVAAALLPGPYTVVLPNPARRFPWLCGETPEAIGVRVPDLPPPARAVVERVGGLASTSANLHGEPDPRRLEDISPALRAAAGALVDAGELPGRPSTVLDLTGAEPRIVREGAVPAAEALARAAEALR